MKNVKTTSIVDHLTIESTTLARLFEQDLEVGDPGALWQVGGDNGENITSMPGTHPLDNLGRIISNSN